MTVKQIKSLVGGALRSVVVRLALSFALAGCGHMPLTSLVTLAKIDFETSDPAQLRAAIKLPVALQPRGVVLRIAVTVGRTGEQTRDFVLREIPIPAELTREASADTHIFAYRLDDTELSRLAAFRAELLAGRSKGQNGSISISVLPRACAMAELQGPIIFTTYLRTAETVRYVTLARDVDLRRLLPRRDVAIEIPPCST